MTVVRSQAGALLLAIDPVESYEAYVDQGGRPRGRTAPMKQGRFTGELLHAEHCLHRRVVRAGIGELAGLRLIRPDRAHPAG
jgi:hypothetical protein